MNEITTNVILTRMRGRPPVHPTSEPTNRLREWREARGWSQQQLADEAGTNNMTVSRHERGEAQLNLHWLEKYAEALQIKPEDLLLAPARMTDRMRALVDLAASMPPELQDQFLRLGRALAEPAAPFIPEQTKVVAQAGSRKKKS